MFTHCYKLVRQKANKASFNDIVFFCARVNVEKKEKTLDNTTKNKKESANCLSAYCHFNVLNSLLIKITGFNIIKFMHHTVFKWFLETKLLINTIAEFYFNLPIKKTRVEEEHFSLCGCLRQKLSTKWSLWCIQQQWETQPKEENVTSSSLNAICKRTLSFVRSASGAVLLLFCIVCCATKVKGMGKKERRGTKFKKKRQATLQ